MDEETTKGSIEWSTYLIPIATFILGSWLMPKMEWLSETVKIWIFAFGAGLLIFSITITKTVQKWLPIRYFWIILGSSIVFIIMGLVLTHINKKHENIDQLRATTDILINDIIHFIAQSPSYSISMPTLTGKKEEDDKILYENWKQQVEASKRKDSMFTNNFHQRIVDIAYKFRKFNIISEEELKHILWVSQPDHPTIDWTLQELQKYNARLK